MVGDEIVYFPVVYDAVFLMPLVGARLMTAAGLFTIFNPGGLDFAWFSFARVRQTVSCPTAGTGAEESSLGG